MCNNEKCAAYFKSRNEYERCFLELWKKWSSYGKAAGMITLPHASVEERRAISGILGKVFYDDMLRFSFVEFEQGLQRTRYAPVEIKAVLEAYFGKPLISNQERLEAREQEKLRFFQELQTNFAKDYGTESPVFLWILRMIETKKYGYQLIVREYQKSKAKAKKQVELIGKALCLLEENKESGHECPLAVFAANVSGNPHAFDRGTIAGQLLIHAICESQGKELPENAYQWRELLTSLCLVPDNISSMIHAYGLMLGTDHGWHPAYHAFCELGEPYVLTMENLRGISRVQTIGKKVYIVENEMVFSYLLEHLRGQAVTLLCTSGQLRSAAIEVLSLIVESGAVMYYSGDMDPDGLGIADRLWQRFGDAVKLWRMSPEDYEKCISEERFGTVGAAKLLNLKHSLLKKTAAVMNEKKLAGYQENLLEELLGDMEQGKNL